MTYVLSRLWIICSILTLALVATSPQTVVAAPEQSDNGRILILPFHVDPGANSEKLGEFARHVDKALRASIQVSGGKLSIESREATRKLLPSGNPPSDQEEALRIGTSSGADLVVFGFLSERPGSFGFKGLLWDVRQGRMRVTTDLNVQNILGLPEVLSRFIGNLNRSLHGTAWMPFYRAGRPDSPRKRSTEAPYPLVSLPKETEGPWRSPNLRTTLRGLSIGDLDGNGKNETILLEPRRVTINRFENGRLRNLAQFSKSPASYISSELADLDGDGVCELILSYETPNGLESEILRYQDRSLKSLGRFPQLLMRTIPDPFEPKGRILVGQRTDRPDIFTGEMIRFKAKDGAITPQGRIHLPPGTLLLSYTSGMMGANKTPLRVILNQDNRLMAFDTDNRLLHTVVDQVFGAENKLRVSRNKRWSEINFPGRLIIADTNGDGENELLVVKQLGGISEIQDLVWAKDGFERKWKTVGDRGLIADFSISDFKNDGSNSMVALLVQFSQNPFLTLISGPSSVVYAYDITP